MAEKVEQEEEFIDIAGEAEKEKKQVIVEKILKPEPVADPKLTKKVLELLQQLLPLRQVKKGVNELLKSITKSEVEVVILAADCDPLEVVMTLSSQCEDKNIPYCFVESKAALGRACGIKRPVVAAGVIFKEGSHLQGQILELKDKLEQLLV